MGMAQLIEYGRQAMQSGHYRRAASLLREAVRRAPMRQDLKDYLGVAIEGALIEEQASPRQAPPNGGRPQPRPAPEERRAAPERSERREARPPRPNDVPRRDYDRVEREYDHTNFEAAPEPRREQRPTRPGAPEPRPERRAESRYDASPEYRATPEPDPAYEAPQDSRRPVRPEPRFELDPEPRPASWADPLDAEDAPPEPAPRPQPQSRPAPRPAAWREESAAEPPRPAARPRPPREEAPLAERRNVRDLRPGEPPPARAPRPRPEGRPEPMRPSAPPPGRAMQYRPADFKRRHHRGPASAMIFGALVGFFMCGVVAAGAWFYFQNNPKMLSALRLPNTQADVKMALARASAYTSKGEYSKAIELLTSQPESPERNKALAEMFSDQGDSQITRQNPPHYEGAIEAYKSAVKYDPNNMHYRSNLASAYYQLAVSQEADRKAAMSSLDSAQQHCESVLNQDSKNLEALQILKRVALKKRDDTLLARTYKRIIESAPGSPEAEEAKKNLDELKLR